MPKQMSGKTFSNLLDYYIACLQQEDMLSVTFNVSSEGTAFLSTLFQTEMLFHTNNNQVSIKNSDGGKKFFQTSLLRQKNKTLFYGYPVVIGPQGTISPLFFTELHFEQTNDNLVLTITSSQRRLNHYILLQQNFPAEEIQNIHQEIEGENFTTALSSICQILNFSNTDCSPALDQKPFKRTIALKLINKAILYFGEHPGITHNLIVELQLLKNKPIDEVASTCLSLLLTGQHPLDNASQETQPILEIFPLNQAQKNAVQNSLRNSLTVITGPPGTGKSQVVLNIIANAVYHNKTVLFASKNNKAVDVVIEKLNALLPYNFLVRMGHQAHRRNAKTQLEQLLKQQILGIPSKHKNRNDLLSVISKMTTVQDQIIRLSSINDSIENIQQILDDLQKQFPNDAPLFEKDPWLETIDSMTLQDDLSKAFQKHKTLSRLYPSRQQKKQEQCFRKYYEALSPVIKDYLERQISNNKINKETALQYILAWKKQSLFLKDLQRMKTTLLTLLPYIDLRNQLRVLQNEHIAISRALILHQWIKTFASTSEEDKQHISAYFSTLEQRQSCHGNPTAFRQIHMQQIRLLQKILKYLPVWVVTNLSVKQCFPLKNNLFDILIIDEASQCDIVSALPLFYRAKHIVVIGDPHQLKHISLLSEAQDKELSLAHQITEEVFSEFSYTKHSLYQLAEKITKGSNQEPVLLNEHYRCHHDIISFSNEYYYDRKLTIATDESKLLHHPTLQRRIIWHHIKGKTIHTKSPYNEEEAERVIEETLRILELTSASHASIGIVTLFRAQSEIITEKLQKFREIFENEITIGTAHRFQGDEKDVILFSPAVSEGVKQGTLHWIQTTKQLLNVAVTRARSLFVIIGDQDVCRQTTGSLKDLSEYVETVKTHTCAFNTIAKKNLYDQLKKHGIFVITDYVIKGVEPCLIDFALFVNGKRYAIEIRENQIQKKKKQALDKQWKIRCFTDREISENIHDVLEEIKRLC